MCMSQYATFVKRQKTAQYACTKLSQVLQINMKEMNGYFVYTVDYDIPFSNHRIRCHTVWHARKKSGQAVICMTSFWYETCLLDIFIPFLSVSTLSAWRNIGCLVIQRTLSEECDCTG